MEDSYEDLPLFSQTATSTTPEVEISPHVRPATSLSAANSAWAEALEEQGRSIHTVKAFTGDMKLAAKYLG